MSRIERLVNLIAALSDTSVPLSYERIVREVPGYEGRSESVRRQFERDKATLREMGIDLQTVPVDVFAGAGGDSVGYRIPVDVTIADPGLTVPERAALTAATALVWGGDDPDDDSVSAAAVGTVPALADQLLQAVEERRRITFDYASASGAVDVPRTRTVEPWRLVHKAGRWYVIGRDVDADDRRTFRLDRVVGSVQTSGSVAFARPSDASEDDGVPVRGWEIGAGDVVPVDVAVRPDREWWFLRETGGTVTGDTAAPTAASAVDGDNWPLVRVDVRDLASFARFVLASLDSAVVVAPSEARRAVLDQIERLTAVVAGDAR